MEMIKKCMACGKFFETLDGNRWRVVASLGEQTISHGYCPPCAVKVLEENGLGNSPEAAKKAEAIEVP